MRVLLEGVVFVIFAILHCPLPEQYYSRNHKSGLGGLKNALRTGTTAETPPVIL